MLSEKLLGVAVYIFVTWAFSIVLMATNSQLIRFLEGYGPLNPLRFRKSRMQRLFRETAFPALEEAKRIDLAREQDRPVLPDLGLQLGKRLRVVVSEFPHEEEWVLATKMGNSIRAFEVYSRVVYGLDAITAWPRLSMILPEQAREHINHSRAVFDFAVNLLLTSFITTTVWFVLCIWFHQINDLWIPIVYSGVFLFSKYMLDNTARQWGEQVKSAFDLYRADLAEQLGLEMPRSTESEHEMWRYVNRMMIYRAKSAAKNLDKFRKKRTASEKVSTTTR